MNNDYYIIKFNLNNYIFEFSPIICYNVFSDEYPYDQKKVILYNLSLDFNNRNDSNGKKNNKINCVIPYYVSDGYTNGLRANLKFPFMCFTNKESKEFCPICDSKKLSENGLIKYFLGYNFKANYINKKIFDEIEDEFHIKINRDLRIGLYSIFPRMNNFLDFIIALSSQKIINFNKDIDISIFRPYKKILIINMILIKLKHILMIMMT